MQTADSSNPKHGAALLANSMRIVIAGMRNTGKSALMNQLLGREAAIVSRRAGATTDPVTRKMELGGLGAIALTDTAGLDDDEGLTAATPEDTEGDNREEALGHKRRRASMQRIAAADLIIFLSKITEAPSEAERQLARELQAMADKRQSHILAVASFAAEQDQEQSKRQSQEQAKLEKLAFLHQINERQKLRGTPGLQDSAGFDVRCWDKDGASWLLCIDNLSGSGIRDLKEYIIALHSDLEAEPSVLDGLVREDDFILLVAPVDLGAPKGRLIHPQVETIRDGLDKDCSVMIVKERELYRSYSRFAPEQRPKLVITDSQVFAKVAADLPEEQPLTSFSILFARKKGDLEQMLQGVLTLENLPDEPRILMMEACSHHRQADDIGSVKIPRLFRQVLRPKAEFFFERSLPTAQKLGEYDLVIHCGGCMSSRRKLLNRFSCIAEAGVPIVNYGLFLGWANGLLPRAIQPFRDLYPKYQNESF